MKTEASKKPLEKGEILHLVEEDLTKVDEDLQALASSSLPLVRRINHHLHSAGGKRLRPAVLLLCARACNYSGPSAIRLGAVVELIHVATLVHDDIIDNSLVRRGQPSANATWGNDVTVLAGDWMYMTAFSLALQLRNFQILDVLIEVTRTMVEGELLQLQSNWSLDLDEKDHLEICARKTACLFSACGRLAALLSEADGKTQEDLAEYGRCLGLAFQMTDDLLDYASDEETLGKPVLKDLEEGKVTLPIIYLLERAEPAETEFIRNIVSERNFSPENKQRIMELVRKHRTLESLRERAVYFAKRAIESAGGLSDSIFRDALLSIPEFIIQRDS